MNLAVLQPVARLISRLTARARLTPDGVRPNIGNLARVRSLR